MTSSRMFQAVFWTALAFAFFMASTPQPAPLPGALNDMHMHVAAFVVLAALAALAFAKTRLRTVFIGLAIFGGLIELVQAIPSLGRTASLFDWFADLVGAGFTLLLLSLVRWLQKQRLNGTP